MRVKPTGNGVKAKNDAARRIVYVNRIFYQLARLAIALLVGEVL